MKSNPSLSEPFRQVVRPGWLLAACAAAVLSACGGEGTEMVFTDAENSTEISSATTTLDLESSEVDAEVSASVILEPKFHIAPVLLDEPSSSDANIYDATMAGNAPIQTIPTDNLRLSTKNLTPETLLQRARSGSQNEPRGDLLQTKAANSVSTYNPAQIRAAYGFPALPSSTSNLSAAQKADLGAGQTIYIVGARHNPNIAAELNAFNQKFGLPPCTSKAIASNSALPLPAANASACELSVVYSTVAGGMTSTVPAYDSGWATEMALDVQWAHAIAPLARLVVIEASDPSLNAIVGAIKLANAMGSGIVSMSLGTNEASFTASVESAFTGANMTYLAATGDSGAGVSWPAVSPKVLAVSGTSLSYTSGSARSETVWSGTGGGYSAYTAVPSYQTTAVPGMNTISKRAVADVAFNADPSTGQYVAVMTPGSSAVNWISAGGTSLATPQWAGLLAIANAKRLVAKKPVLGTPHSVIYGQLAASATTYASSFKDITQGSNGTCSFCLGEAAYDTPTGLGTPNASAFLTAISGVTVTPAAPVVTPATIAGTAATPLSFTVSVSAANPVSYNLSGAPSGMSISSLGVVSWAKPVTGTYLVTVTAKDTVTGKTGQAVYKVDISAAKAPVGTNTSLTGQTGKALNFSVTFQAGNPLTYSMKGAPSGMSLNASTGQVNWASPVTGKYTVTFTAKDTRTGLSGSAVYTVTISPSASPTAPTGPVITAAPVTGTPGKAITGTINISDPGAIWFQMSISGVPRGMMFAVNGSAVTYSWASPVTGNYALNVTVVDNLGRRAQASVPITIK